MRQFRLKRIRLRTKIAHTITFECETCRNDREKIIKSEIMFWWFAVAIEQLSSSASVDRNKQSERIPFHGLNNSLANDPIRVNNYVLVILVHSIVNLLFFVKYFAGRRWKNTWKKNEKRTFDIRRIDLLLSDERSDSTNNAQRSAFTPFQWPRWDILSNSG